MLIKGLYSESEPTLQDWGTAYKHVPLNVREEETIDSEGNKVTGYRYDCVEKVPVPVTADNIVRTALEASFSKDDIAYVQANIFKTDDVKVQAYMSLAAEINGQSKEAGY